MHRLETLRDRLLDDDDALTKLLNDNPQADVQQLRAVIRAARKESWPTPRCCKARNRRRSTIAPCSRPSRPSPTDCARRP